MSATTDQSTLPDPVAAKSNERRALGTACGAHALHDGYTDLVYVMLPIWQGEFGLGFAALGLMRTVFSGTLAGFQIPAGFLAERFGAATVLALGTALAGFGYIFAGSAAALRFSSQRCSLAASAQARSIRSPHRSSRMHSRARAR